MTHLLDDPLVAQRASVEANRMRGTWLMALAEGRIGLVELLDAAVSEDGRPLTRLKLVQVLASQPDWSMTAAEKVMSKLGRRFKFRGPASKVTLGWLIDTRAKGNRLTALGEILAPREMPGGVTPWTGGLP